MEQQGSNPNMTEDLGSLTRLGREVLARTNRFEFPRILLESLGIKQIEFARKHGFRKADVSECLRGMNRHAKIRNALAKEMGVDLELLWPKLK